MDLGRKNIKKIRGLILFTAIVILALVKFDAICQGIVFLLSIVNSHYQITSEFENNS